MASAAVRRHYRVQRQRRLNQDVQVLVLGAGVIGCAYAVQLARWGMDVTLVARGRRLEELAVRGVSVRDVLTRRQLAGPVLLTGQVPSREYDLVLVAVQFPEVGQALEAVKPLAETSPVLVLQNNPVGAEPLLQVLEGPSILMGFPGTGGVRWQGEVYHLPFWLGETVLGESNGSRTHRLQLAAAILRRAGLTVRLQRRMVPWLQSHAAMIAVLAGCILRNGGQLQRFARDIAEVQHYFSALNEAFALLEGAGIPVVPRSLRAHSQPLWRQTLLTSLASFLPGVNFIVEGYLRDKLPEFRETYRYLLTLAKAQEQSVSLLQELGAYIEV